VAEAIACAARGDEEPAEQQGVRADHPLRGGTGTAEPVPDLRQPDHGDRHAEDVDELGQAQQQDSPAFPHPFSPPPVPIVREHRWFRTMAASARAADDASVETGLRRRRPPSIQVARRTAAPFTRSPARSSSARSASASG
jgi:hypothetical protein